MDGLIFSMGVGRLVVSLYVVFGYGRESGGGVNGG